MSGRWDPHFGQFANERLCFGSPDLQLKSLACGPDTGGGSILIISLNPPFLLYR